MKARVPQSKSPQNLQQIAKQAQKLQEKMSELNQELDEKEYTATAGGDAVKATVLGKMEVKSIDIKPEVVDPEDVEMLSDLVMAAVNEALRAAAKDKEEQMESLSGGLNMPGLF
ncbi:MULTISPECIES: YbaB/EbfC family nucleoid-associated protein [Caproicibacterium]|uniref:Nucleoid-associated protein GJQ69_02385 n=1 Tax=Caproicibacterium lactatifermentans TaxID=2666138 RepID=A0A859DPG4_9FIRM|nr:YbaB/EbfC family nucleoid-associated protein [Caproicibacterium lactatifermentans]ARP50833.1 YbaB/EbfC family nucleoid-associated protein [Ruminococcaceae bacterium CPB6]MDD4807726.1 YbaB/EbfC family nucleoid-associated protein [Oscillospiraceae bacterium]QKN23439.1 YbaB/EbfC family nucleoid-associated protein [Caproicibacterium lactatifermentans]QKO29882.1 YbaB/EbfC family nucleoid-associated protein [Caproicibacterium lactatifermentans]